MTIAKKQINKAKNYLAAVALMSSFAFMGCQPDKVTEKVPQKVSVNEQMNSDELTNSAEQLVGPYTFMLAYKTAVMAVEKDPTNLKAQFYVKLLKRFEAFRGVLNRIKPLLTASQLKDIEKTIKDFPESPLKIFLLDNKNKSEIKTVGDVQTVYGEYFSAVADFRQFLKDNQSAELTIYLNPNIFEQQIKKELANSCGYNQNPDGSWDVNCQYNMIATKKLNIADLIVIRQMASAELVYSFFTNSYSLDGLEELAKIDPNGRMTNQQKAAFFESLPGFGKLRKDQNLKLMKEMGSDLSVAVKWVQQYQKDICAKGTSTKNQRKSFLFQDGICIEQQSQSAVNQFLSVLDRALGGTTQIELKDSSDRPMTMNMNIFAWASNPIQDLRQIKPTSWNSCDHATNLADNTLGGIFVDSNVQTLLEKSNCK
jgi:hypothetical protein